LLFSFSFETKKKKKEKQPNKRTDSRRNKLSEIKKRKIFSPEIKKRSQRTKYYIRKSQQQLLVP
jgi:hypothetical protein